MPFDDLLPVNDAVVAHAQLFNKKCIGNILKVHTAQDGIPDLEGVDIVILGLRENRGAPDSLDRPLDFSQNSQSAISAFSRQLAPYCCRFRRSCRWRKHTGYLFCCKPDYRKTSQKKNNTPFSGWIPRSFLRNIPWL